MAKRLKGTTMGLFSRKKNSTSGSSQNTELEALVDTAIDMGKEYIQVADLSNEKERDTVDAFRENMIPVLMMGKQNINAVVPEGLVGIMQAVCITIITTLDGSNEKEKQLMQNAHTLFLLIKDLPSNVKFV